MPERAHNAGLTAERLVDGVHRRAGALGDARNRGRRVTLLETSTEIIGGKLAAGGPALLFGHGQNPINFISVCDVAALVEQAIQDPLLRGETIDVPGLDNLTMTQIAQLLGATKIRRIPCGGLRFLSAVARPVAPAFARQAAAAVVMDTTDMSRDAAALQSRFPQITWHLAADLIAARGAANT